MLNFKIERPTDKLFEIVKDGYDYKFKGKTYKMTPETLRTASPELQQSFGAFAAKMFPQLPLRAARMVRVRAKRSQTTDVAETGGTYLPQKVESKRSGKRKELIIRELRRLARSEKIVEEKLNYPKVFQALLTEPHTAFEHRKKTVEESFNLTLFIDTNVRYWVVSHMGPDVESALPADIIDAAKNIKGITVFAGNALHGITYKNKTYQYYTDLYNDLPPHMKKNVIVLSQGCGGVGTYDGFKPKSVKFVTSFVHGKNCGCSQIARAASAGQIMTYGVNCATKLSLIK